MKKILACLLFSPVFAAAQTRLPDANVIIIKHVGFLQVCNALLDSGYVIEKKDNDLMTAKTSKREYPNRWNATYDVYIRVKDSIAFMRGTFTAPPGGGLFIDEPIRNFCNKKGETKEGSMAAYPFVILDRFAHGFGQEVAYDKVKL